jgi:hypothetical protein
MGLKGGNHRQRPAVASENGPGGDRNQSSRSRRESAVLTNRPADEPVAVSRLVRSGAAILLSAMTLTTVHAGGVGTMSCVRGAGAVNCVGQWRPGGDPNVRTVPPKPLGDEERAQAAARERNWLAQCQPEIRRDPYGVARYIYAARGCEYGVGAD